MRNDDIFNQACGPMKSKEEQVKDNQFPLHAQPIWLHCALTWASRSYALSVLDYPDANESAAFEIGLETLLMAEAEFCPDTHRNGKLIPHLVAEHNAELEARAAWLESLAAQIRKLKVLQVVGGTGGDISHD